MLAGLTFKRATKVGVRDQQSDWQIRIKMEARERNGKYRFSEKGGIQLGRTEGSMMSRVLKRGEQGEERQRCSVERY